MVRRSLTLLRDAKLTANRISPRRLSERPPSKTLPSVNRSGGRARYFEEVQVTVLPPGLPVVSSARIENELLHFARVRGVALVVVPELPEVFDRHPCARGGIQLLQDDASPVIHVLVDVVDGPEPHMQDFQQLVLMLRGVILGRHNPVDRWRAYVRAGEHFEHAFLHGPCPLRDPSDEGITLAAQEGGEPFIGVEVDDPQILLEIQPASPSRRGDALLHVSLPGRDYGLPFELGRRQSNRLLMALATLLDLFKRLELTIRPDHQGEAIVERVEAVPVDDLRIPFVRGYDGRDVVDRHVYVPRLERLHDIGPADDAEINVQSLFPVPPLLPSDYRDKGVLKRRNPESYIRRRRLGWITGDRTPRQCEP